MLESDHPPLTIAVIDAEPAARLGIRYHLQQFPRFQIAFELDSITGGETLIATERPDIAIVDTDLDGGGGFELIRRFQAGRVPCVAWLRRMHRKDVLAAMQVRARGILSRREPLSELMLALMAVLSGYTHLSEAVALALYDGGELIEHAHYENLPARQSQVYRLIGEGLSPAEIAFRLGISLKTVHTHIERLKIRLGCRNQAALTRLAAIESTVV